MKSLNDVSKREFALRILNVLTTNTDAVKTAGVDASVKAGKLKALIDEAFATKDAQIAAQVNSLMATKRARLALEDAYAEASAVVELIVGSLGRQDALVHRMKRLRGEVSRGTDSSTDTAVEQKTV
ncbi:MAG: hypothetical protein HZC28_10480 [Spirochaetes bacterium]|nr:hypothetical protein [Spirochaetota bacterium]